MPYTNGLPPADTVSPDDLVVILQGSTTTPGTGTTRSAKVSQLPAGGGGGGGGAVSSVNGQTGDVVIHVGDIPGVAPLSSPGFTGVPTAPTAPAGTTNGTLANAAFVAAAIASEAAVRASADAALAPLSSPVFVGTPHVPLAPIDTNTDQAASTAFVLTAISEAGGFVGGGVSGVSSVNGRTGAVTIVAGDVAGVAGLASPVFTGDPQAPTAPVGDNDNSLANTAFVRAALSGTIAGLAPIASPGFTGIPTAPTQIPTTAVGTTQLATTAFVRTGTTTNDFAIFGQVGEFIFKEVTDPAAVSLTNGFNANIIQMSLSPGDWEVSGAIQFTPTGATFGSLSAWTSNVSATPPNVSLVGYMSSSVTFQPGVFEVMFVPPRRFSLATVTIIYLSTQVAYSGGTMTACGYIQGRRMR